MSGFGVSRFVRFRNSPCGGAPRACCVLLGLGARGVSARLASHAGVSRCLRVVALVVFVLR
eukprot:1161280-Prorocentrum_lima.AAC.1